MLSKLLDWLLRICLDHISLLMWEAYEKTEDIENILIRCFDLYFHFLSSYMLININ